MVKAAFLDRDGVINKKAPEGQYVTRWEEMQILPGVPQAISAFNAAGFHVIVVSNQRCVAKELISIPELELLHERMCRFLRDQGARIDAIYYCPHDFEPPCDCRKPKPGMLLAATRIHDIDIENSWMIGDSELDVLAGRTAGCKVAFISSNSGTIAGVEVIADSLLSAAHQILNGCE